jgi:hypothetical protein
MAAALTTPSRPQGQRHASHWPISHARIKLLQCAFCAASPGHATQAMLPRRLLLLLLLLLLLPLPLPLPLLSLPLTQLVHPS